MEDAAGSERPYEGLEGDEGFYGIDLESDNRYFLHIAFANDDEGRGFSSTDVGIRKYIGYYVDRETANSHEPGKYNWEMIVW